MSTGAHALNTVQQNRACIGRSIGAAASRLRASANMAGKKPNIDRIGISYMLQGDAGADGYPRGKTRRGDHHKNGGRLEVSARENLVPRYKDQNRPPVAPLLALRSGAGGLRLLPQLRQSGCAADVVGGSQDDPEPTLPTRVLKKARSS